MFFQPVWQGIMMTEYIEDEESMEPVVLPIEDTLDLHTFRPNEVPDLLNDYFSECISSGIYSVRVIHGKGRGILRKRVRSLLKKNPLVVSYKEAPPEAGGWGAVQVELKKL
jgi:DNA-nicking Smr family endonuclease